MEADRVISELHKRLNNLELLLGGAKGCGNLNDKLEKVVSQLRQVYKRGSEFNEDIASYLRIYMGYVGLGVESCGIRDMEVVLLASYDAIKELVGSLQELDLWGQDDIDKIVSGCAVVGISDRGLLEADLSNLPVLVERCNELTIRSIQTSLRFLRLNQLQNEGFSALESRILKFERDLCSS